MTTNLSNRHFFRVNYVTNATVMLPEVSFEAKTDNLSAGGMFIRTDYSLSVGNVVTVNFSIPSASHPSITLKGKVLRKNQQGLAIEFISLDYHTFTNLKAFIKHKPLPYW